MGNARVSAPGSISGAGSLQVGNANVSTVASQATHAHMNWGYSGLGIDGFVSKTARYIDIVAGVLVLTTLGQ